MREYQNIIVNENNLRLDKFIKNRYTNVNNSLLQKAIRNKDILLNEQKTTADTVLKINDQISLTDFIFKILNKKNENN
ncbi:MAG: hypothetical protein LBH46_04020, partial [Rickettsiales bacterium]|nr:hypothetical protein [Rickettsiales bacterium]